MQDAFWSQHLTLAEAGRKLGMSRQNVHQRVNRGSIPSAVDESGKRGVPIEFVNKDVELRGDVDGNEG